MASAFTQASQRWLFCMHLRSLCRPTCVLLFWLNCVILVPVSVWHRGHHACQKYSLNEALIALFCNIPARRDIVLHTEMGSEPVQILFPVIIDKCPFLKVIELLLVFTSSHWKYFQWVLRGLSCRKNMTRLPWHTTFSASCRAESCALPRQPVAQADLSIDNQGSILSLCPWEAVTAFWFVHSKFQPRTGGVCCSCITGFKAVVYGNSLQSFLLTKPPHRGYNSPPFAVSGCLTQPSSGSSSFW